MALHLRALAAGQVCGLLHPQRRRGRALRAAGGGAGRRRAAVQRVPGGVRARGEAVLPSTEGCPIEPPTRAPPIRTSKGRSWSSYASEALCGGSTDEVDAEEGPADPRPLARAGGGAGDLPRRGGAVDRAGDLARALQAEGGDRQPLPAIRHRRTGRHAPERGALLQRTLQSGAAGAGRYPRRRPCGGPLGKGAGGDRDPREHRLATLLGHQPGARGSDLQRRRPRAELRALHDRIVARAGQPRTLQSDQASGGAGDRGARAGRQPRRGGRTARTCRG